jgi:hypothetical protein
MILRLAREVENDRVRRDALSTDEKIAVALVLDRPEWCFTLSWAG